jgi:hypothetical protein
MLYLLRGDRIKEVKLHRNATHREHASVPKVSSLPGMSRLFVPFRMALLLALFLFVGLGHGHAMAVETSGAVPVAAAHSQHTQHDRHDCPPAHCPAPADTCPCCVAGFCTLAPLPLAATAFPWAGRAPTADSEPMAVTEALPPNPFRPPARSKQTDLS